MTKNYPQNCFTDSAVECLRPKRSTVKFLLDYSKSLKVVSTKFGDFETIQN
ncbi:hypothetical protein SAMN05444278_10146 [Psychroflexus salarius]|uniref:Uncharacterized protein n=1 Tax=Psychroflexus salarius TaxID=1155689 RepID=A0A1M4SA42_9FLAO|nr:hypothetical protein SAMN05444278_10146 [Psychroflexus salarius]